jgi:hypothetical protein
MISAAKGAIGCCVKRPFPAVLLVQQRQRIVTVPPHFPIPSEKLFDPAGHFDEPKPFL